MAKFSLLTTLTLNAAGFDKGIDQSKKKTKDFGDGVNKMGNGVKGVFSSFAGLTAPITKDLGGLTSMTSGVLGGFKQMVPALKGVKMAIIGAGVGAIIIAITAALTGLYTWLKRSDEGSDTMRKGLNILKGVMEVILDRVALMGGAIVKLFKGDFKGAAQDARNAFKGIKGDVQENINKANELSELQKEAELFNMEYATKRAELEVKLSDLQVKSRDKENYSAKERLKYLEEYKQSNKELYDLDSKQRQYKIDEEKLSQSLGYSSREDKKKLNELEAEGIRTRAEYNNRMKETVRLGSSISKEAQKEAEELEKLKNFKVPQVTLEIEDVKLDIADSSEAISSFFDDLQDVIDEENQNIKLINYFDAFGEFKDIMNDVDFQSKLITNSVNDISDAFVELGETGSMSFSKMVGNMINSIRSVLNALLAKAIIGLFSGEVVTKGVIGLATAAAGVSVLMGVWNKYAKFEHGGIVGGTSFSGDNIPIRVNSGEMILNKSQQSNLFKMLNGGGNGGGEVTFRIQGDTLVGVLNNHSKKINSYL